MTTVTETLDAALAQPPENTRATYEAKGRLTNPTKDIISAAQALHAAAPEAAAKYNSKLRYRRPSRGKTEVEGTGTGTTGTTTEMK